MIWGIFLAFLFGFFFNRFVSSNKRNGPPLSWWSIEELFNQYMHWDNGKRTAPRPI